MNQSHQWFSLHSPSACIQKPNRIYRQSQALHMVAPNIQIQFNYETNSHQNNDSSAPINQAAIKKHTILLGEVEELKCSNWMRNLERKAEMKLSEKVPKGEGNWQ